MPEWNNMHVEERLDRGQSFGHVGKPGKLFQIVDLFGKVAKNGLFLGLKYIHYSKLVYA